MHFGHGNRHYDYKIGNTSLKSESVIRDLGVLVTPSLKYSEHVADVVSRASRRYNWLLRSFNVKNVDLYMKLFNTYVMPIVSYASPVWYPRLLKDQNLLQKMQRKFVKRVSFRCGIDIAMIKYTDILSILNENDKNMFQTIKNNDTRFQSMFSTTVNNTRRGENIYPRAMANKSSVKGMYAWRLSASIN